MKLCHNLIAIALLIGLTSTSLFAQARPQINSELAPSIINTPPFNDEGPGAGGNTGGGK